MAAVIKGKANRVFARSKGARTDENGARSIRSEFVDGCCASIRTALGCVEVAGAVESETPALTRNGAEDDPFAIWCELEDSAGPDGTSLIVRHDIGIARDVYGQAFKEKLGDAASRTDLVAQVVFQHSPNEEVTVARRISLRCEEIANSVKSQPSREQQPRSIGTLGPRRCELEDFVRSGVLS